MERRCYILGPTQRRISPSILQYTKTSAGFIPVSSVSHQFGDPKSRQNWQNYTPILHVHLNKKLPTQLRQRQSPAARASVSLSLECGFEGAPETSNSYLLGDEMGEGLEGEADRGSRND